MAQVTLCLGDTFKAGEDYGVVLPGHNALVVYGEGGRTGWRTEKVVTPGNAVPHDLKGVHVEIRLQLEAVRKAIL